MSCPVGTEPESKSQSRLRRLGNAALVSLPMLLLTAMMAMGRPQEPGTSPDRFLSAALAASWLFVNTIFFLMAYTGRTARYRRLFFVTLAVAFVIGFITNLLAVRGSMALSRENMIEGETPFCHMVIPMVLIPAAITRTIIFPGSLLTGFASIASMLCDLDRRFVGAGAGLVQLGLLLWGHGRRLFPHPQKTHHPANRPQMDLSTLCGAAGRHAHVGRHAHSDILRVVVSFQDRHRVCQN